jgi:hypothetical protein
LAKVVVDYNMATGKQKKKINTGLWSRIYKGSEVSEKSVAVGLNLLCEGKALKKGSNNKNVAKVKNLLFDETN